MEEDVRAVQFYVDDLAESMQVTSVNDLTKAELAKQLDVWRNSVSVASSILREVFKKEEEDEC